MRVRFPQRRRLAVPQHNGKDFIFDPPPELPRTIEVSAVRKSLPWVFGVVIVGMVVMMFVTGFRQMNPIYLFFMAMMAIALFQSMQSQGVNSEMSTPEVNSERAEYLRYLSGKAEEIRDTAAAQRASARWSHPDPDVLEAVLGSPRMWERGSSDPDYLHIRIGRDEVRLASKIKVKPVAFRAGPGAGHHDRPAAHEGCSAVNPALPQSDRLGGVRHDRRLRRPGRVQCGAAGVDLPAGVLAYPQRHGAGGGVTASGVAVELDESGCRTPKATTSTGQGRRDIWAPRCVTSRPCWTRCSKSAPSSSTTEARWMSAAVTKAHKHVVLIVDDPDAAPAMVRRIAARDGVTVIAYRDTAGPDRDYAAHQRELLLKLDRVDSGGAVRMRLAELPLADVLH